MVVLSVSMSSSNTDPSSRKPSGSSTRSGGHSPTSSPSKTNSQRKPAPSGGANNMFGVAMSSTNTLKGLNSGWQVWGNAVPTSKRTTSISSVTSGPDVSSAQGETHYRSNLGEPWNATRSSGAWEETNGSPKKKDMYPMVKFGRAVFCPYGKMTELSLRLHVHSIAVQEDRPAALSKAGQYSPQRFEGNLSKESTVAPRYSIAVSPSKATSFNSSPSTFAGQQSGLSTSASGAGYEASQAPATVETDLSLALRGMTVEDDYGMSHANGQYAASSSMGQATNGPGQSPQGVMPPIRVAHPLQQARMPYGAYPQSINNAYYTGPHAGQVDYAYSYDSYRGVVSDPSVYTSSAAVNAASSPTSVYPTVSFFLHALTHLLI
ncbi:hypothetical protein NEOLEDRAFT_1196393 [Neolentinus lepideus HHB14362 ss-1]|uniref:Uncharacterized protein n=1 Tax=Neolentinus lepideus HHB14362 ss-1 TaxID=1314782 RepID=A0A165TC27_9AGAM|nr:hypothetical protein NEOLEDRAFT_1196393 [Neolentinus lepideus HHB14362 ss-1]